MSTTTPEQLESHVDEAIEQIWNEGNFSFIDKNFADDFVLHETTQPEPIRGIEAFKSYVQGLRSAFPDIEITDFHVVAEDETAAVRYSWRGTHQGELLGVEPTGKSVEATGMAFLRFEDGKRKEDWWIDDNLGLLQQLGVVDAPSP